VPHVVAAVLPDEPSVGHDLIANQFGELGQHCAITCSLYVNPPLVVRVARAVLSELPSPPHRLIVNPSRAVPHVAVPPLM
jgi:hypothetical protein